MGQEKENIDSEGFNFPWIKATKEYLESANQLLTESKTEDLNTLASRISHSWLDLYEKEFHQILNMPQFGLTRYYQEHAARAVEKFKDFQAQMIRFTDVLCEPIIHTIQRMREESGTGNGSSPFKDSKEQYKKWIAKLEAAYLDLLRSPQYGDLLASFVKALRDYRTSKEQLLIDLFQELPVTTHKDMDALYKEIYTLKKRVKKLEKEGGRSA